MLDGVMTPGEELEAARIAMGLSLQEVSDRTRIPKRYLEALEHDDTSVFPTGPFLVGFSRKYRTLVGLPDRAPLNVRPDRRDEPDEPVHTVTSPSHPSSTTRKRASQTAVIGGLAVIVAVLVLRGVGDRLSDAGEDPASVGEPMDLEVQVDVEEATRVRSYADGNLRFSDALRPGPGMTFQGRDQVSVEIETLDGVELQFQGKPLKPLGHQSRPRRLIFIDDGH